MTRGRPASAGAPSAQRPAGGFSGRLASRSERKILETASLAHGHPGPGDHELARATDYVAPHQPHAAFCEAYGDQTRAARPRARERTRPNAPAARAARVSLALDLSRALARVVRF